MHASFFNFIGKHQVLRLYRRMLVETILYAMQGTVKYVRHEDTRLVFIF